MSDDAKMSDVARPVWAQHVEDQGAPGTCSCGWEPWDGTAEECHRAYLNHAAAYLAEAIREARCECGHEALEYHADRCNATLGDRPEDRAEALLHAIFGAPCPCEASDSTAIATALYLPEQHRDRP